jgi:hydroxymethylpyrimidine/phosphomethylpyrimidine kinase
MNRRNLSLTPKAGAKLPVALTVAGSDSGGGAGIQADLKTFASVGVHGTSALTCITAQNPLRVKAVHACTPSMVRRQLESIFEELPPVAAKTGMLYSAPIIKTVAEFFSSTPRVSLVVDPVMVATSGARLLQAKARRSLCDNLLPLATLVTPNLAEAQILAESSLRSLEDARTAARQLRERYGCAVLLKGGHLKKTNHAIDVFYDGKKELLLRGPFVKGVRLHGAGCTLSAAITGYLALGYSLIDAVQKGKDYITEAILQRSFSGRYTLLNHYWGRT